MIVPLISWMDPEYLLQHYGNVFVWLSLAIVFIECGLLFPILPGDSLLFSVGLFIRRGDVDLNIALACVIFSVVAFLGNVAGYEIGRAIGTPLYERDGRIIKKKYIDQTSEFFDKYGNRALVLGRFVPIVRTFITVVAGVGRMPRARFFTWSAVGAVLWATGLMLLGYALGSIQLIHDHLESAILLIVAFSVLPMVYEYWNHRRRIKSVASDVAHGRNPSDELLP